MTGTYRLTPRARDGLRRIVAQTEERFGPEVASRVIDEIARAFDRLAAYPSIGHRRSDITPSDRILFWSVAPTLIAYRSTAGGVEILFVERGEADWNGILGESRVMESPGLAR